MNAIQGLSLVKITVRPRRLRVHASNANQAPVCGGGNNARGTHWQTDFAAPDCLRCLSILQRQSEREKSRRDVAAPPPPEKRVAGRWRSVAVAGALR